MATYRVTTEDGQFWREGVTTYTLTDDAEDDALERWAAGPGLGLVLDVNGGTLYAYVLNEGKHAYVAYSIYEGADDDFEYSRAWERELTADVPPPAA